MSRRKDPASVVVEFFETAAPDAAQMMLRVVTGIVKRRVPAQKRATPPSPATGPQMGLPGDEP